MYSRNYCHVQSLYYNPPQQTRPDSNAAMQEPAAQFVTDDENEIAIRTDRIRSVSLVVKDDETKGVVTFNDEYVEPWTISEKQARQIIRSL